MVLRREAKADGGAGSVTAQLGSLLRPLAGSGQWRPLGLLVAGAATVVCANAQGQIRLNACMGAFYDAIGRRDVPGFAGTLSMFVAVIAVLLCMVVAQTWLQETIRYRLRAWLTRHLLDEWLAPRRACLLAHAGEVGVNPDQRMQEDARHLSDLSTDLGVGCLQATFLLVSFIGVLWGLSCEVPLTLRGCSFSVPGYMVWCALIYAFSGSYLAWRVGRPLVRLNSERYAREAALRFGLMRANEHAEAIALHGGEADERRSLDGSVEALVDIMRDLTGRLARLTWVTSGYGWGALVVPVLVAAPGYFQGGMSFGGLMMVVGAFQQVQSALRWFVDNLPRIADWRATLLRVVTIREALVALGRDDEKAERIALGEHATGGLAFDRLVLALPDGRAVLGEAEVEVQPGRHLLIEAEQAADQEALFRAVAGLWPRGTGAIRRPPADHATFLPERPYFPLGSLRAALAYPRDPAALDDDELRAALDRVGLGHLAGSLDREERWDKSLTLEEQQRLALARLLLQRPRWVFLEDATAAIGEERCRLLVSLFRHELAGATVVGIGRGTGLGGFYARTVRLHRLRPGTQPYQRHRPYLVHGPRGALAGAV